MVAVLADIPMRPESEPTRRAPRPALRVVRPTDVVTAGRPAVPATGRPASPATRPAVPAPRAVRSTLHAAPATRRRGRLDHSVYVRRRLMVAGLLLLATAAALVLVRSAWAGTGGGALTSTGAAAFSGTSPAAAASYVVKPGDTLWTIAHTLDPNGDERPLVQQLSAELGGATLYPGESIPVPGST